MLQSQLSRHAPDGMTVSYLEDAMPRGPAGALRDAGVNTNYDTFIVTDGSSIPQVDLIDLLAHHRAARATVTVLVHHESARHGNPCVQVPTGIYVCNREALEDVPARGFFDLKENLIPYLHQSGKRVVAYGTEGAASPRVLNASSYLAVNQWMVEQLVIGAPVPEGYSKTGDCLYHRDALVADNVDVVGPVIIGPGARVMTGAVIAGPTSIGREAVVGSQAFVSRSAVWRRSVIGNDAIADRCILADDTVVKPGIQAFRAVMFPNFRSERTEGSPAMGAQHALSLESVGKRRRLTTGASLSRYPAAQ
jgi:NDP-sugar pyrophosphorylase family protein